MTKARKLSDESPYSRSVSLAVSTDKFFQTFEDTEALQPYLEQINVKTLLQEVFS